MKIKIIITILILIVGANNVYAQTETRLLLIDSTKLLETEKILPKNDMYNLLRNPYPVQLPIIDLHDQQNLPTATTQKDTTPVKIMFVRSAFATNESPLFGKLPIKSNQEITFKLTEEFIKSLIFEFRLRQYLKKYLITNP